jgi:hypothetical protein
MNYQQKTLLAGIATLALAAGTGLTSAQEASPQQQSKQPHATQQMNQAPTGKVEQNRGSAAQQPDQHAQESNRANKSDKSATEEQRKGPDAAPRERNGTAAQQENGNRKDNTAAQHDHNGMQRDHTGMEGLQGNASGMHAKLTDEQRTRIRDTVIHASGAPRVGKVDFDVTVGTVIPRGAIHVIPVPEMLVQIEPEWSGFLYFVYEDEVVVVNPRDMSIVAVVPA